jgi:hypothetical protein
MEFTKQIDSAPKNGDFIILQDACSRELGRWAQEANGWVQPDGTPVRISPTHWTRPSDDIDGWTDRERLLFLDAPLPDDETEQTQKRPLTRLILALVIAIVSIGGFVFWIGSEDLSSDSLAAKLEREFSRERDQASVAIGGLTAAREREDVALTEALESKRIADSKQKETKQALDESEARSEALARELASACENVVAAQSRCCTRARKCRTVTGDQANCRRQAEGVQESALRFKKSADHAAAAARKTKQENERNPTSRPLAPDLRPAHFANLKIFDLATGFYGRGQPARLLPAPRPCFGSLRIAIFWKDPRVFTPGLTIRVVGLRSLPALDDAPATIENRQTLFKFTLFRRDPGGQNPANLLME